MLVPILPPICHRLRYAMPFVSKLSNIMPLALAIAAMVAAEVQAETQLSFAIKGSLVTQPDYFGAEDYSASVSPGLTPKFIRLNNGKTFGNPDPWAEKSGYAIAPSLRVIGERDADSYSEFTGLDDIDLTIELGAELSYTDDNIRVFGSLRRGFGGHEGYAGELGLDLIARPAEKWRLAAGPRIGLGDTEFADTYFGIATSTPEYGAYEAEGGVLSAGLAVEARYQINENWGLTGEVEWNRYQNDAADSPIVLQGSDSETSVSLGLTRVLRLNF